MQHQGRMSPARRVRTSALLGAGALVVMGATLSLTVFSQAKPKDDDRGDGRERMQLAQANTPMGAGEVQPLPRRSPEAKPKPKADPAKPEGSKVVPPKDAGPGSLAGAAAAGASTSNAAYNLSARLTQNGAGTCAGVIDAEAAPTMVGVTDSNTISQWSNLDPRDKHAASVVIGQRYGQNPAVPFGVTSMIASPTLTGTCDITTVQVVSSPLPCSKVRETLARTGKVLGDLAGIPVIGTTEGQTLLMPTATNSCVLIAFRSRYGG